MSIQFCARIPDIKLKFSDVLKEEEDSTVGQHISGCHTITQRPTTVLTGGQALITFEEKKGSLNVALCPHCPIVVPNDEQSKLIIQKISDIRLYRYQNILVTPLCMNCAKKKILVLFVGVVTEWWTSPFQINFFIEY